MKRLTKENLLAKRSFLFCDLVPEEVKRFLEEIAVNNDEVEVIEGHLERLVQYNLMSIVRGRPNGEAMSKLSEAMLLIEDSSCLSSRVRSKCMSYREILWIAMADANWMMRVQNGWVVTIMPAGGEKGVLGLWRRAWEFIELSIQETREQGIPYELLEQETIKGNLGIKTPSHFWSVMRHLLKMRVVNVQQEESGKESVIFGTAYNQQ